MKFPLITILFLFLTGSISAQNFYKERILSRNNILSIGGGPSFAYLDNGGQYEELLFKINPIVSIGLDHRLTSSFFVSATAGIQWITHGGNPDAEILNSWVNKDGSFTAEGQVYYFDLMPGISLKRLGNHMKRTHFNIHGAVGLGILNAHTQQTKSFNPDETPTSHMVTTGYIPIKSTFSFWTGHFSDIALEFKIMFTFSDNLDGNVGFNLFGDHLFQSQIVYKRYLVQKSQK